MMTGTKAPLGPGEQRTRQRRRNQWIFLGIAAGIGGVVGGATGFFDQGEGHLFGGDFAAMRLPPAMAVVLALAFLVSCLALPLYGFRLVDDYKREHSYIAFTGGCLSVLAGYPVWAVLHAGGFVPAPHAFGLFAVAYVSMLLAFLYARWRH